MKISKCSVGGGWVLFLTLFCVGDHFTVNDLF